ncbi:MAG: DNA translocase FtsK [Chloroflexota bacterium]|nr:DNA translocase FtsK [Chloroflexota bacterium]MDE2909103.1 DNA translocase FtsK [Chloroflexota bacterium]
MSYRDDNEPEYFDDAEYFDSEDSAGRRSNVLGGSGSWRGNEPADDQADDSLPPTARGQSARAESRNRPKRASSGGERKRVKARNPAPSVASSEERRARLAGKKPGAKDRRSQPPPHKEETQQQRDENERESRLSRLRRRLSRAEKQADPKRRRNVSRLSAFTGRIGGPIGRLRGRFPGARDREASPTADRARESRGPAPSGGDQRPAASARGGVGFSARPSRTPKEQARESTASRAPKIESAGWLDLDRKLDLIGVALVFGAIVFFFSALSAEQAAISSVNRIIGQALGWGAVAVPAAMFAIGVWLIVRHFGEEAPTIDPVRLSGVGLSFLGVLVLFQYAESFSYVDALSRFEICRSPTNPACVDALVQQSYLAGGGGGLVGGWIYSALVNNLTEAGGFVMTLMVITFSAMLITRSSMAELTIVAIGVGRSLRTQLSHYAASRRAARLQAQQKLAQSGHANHVRVSKPQAAQLEGDLPGARALPEPSGATMPAPQRLRAFFDLRGKLSAVARRESLPLAAAAAGVEASENPGALERFLNLGDNLPFSTEESPVWQRPARPPSAQPPPPRQKDSEAERVVSSRSDALLSKREERKPEAVKTVDHSHKIAPPIETASEAKAGAANDVIDEPLPAGSSSAEAAVVDSQAAAVSAKRSDKEDGAQAEAHSKPAPDAKGAAATLSLSAPRPRISWQLPDHRALLNSGAEGEMDLEPLERQARVIEDTLASFGAPGRVVEINSGPVITQYGVEPAYLTAKSGKQNRVKVGAIAKLDKDLQLALGARSIRVEAPVPGKGYVGIEVPNPASARVSLRDVMESPSYLQIESPLAIALGVSADGRPISGDLTQMPHLLIAGATGSGKSVCVNAIINSIIARNPPDAVKFIMIDPKRVELTGYNGVPHLVAPVVVELERTIGVLRWVTTEMDARYNKFSQAGARNIVDYNSILDPDLAPMPYIVVIIDELADLMMMAPDDTERAITRIAAMARATGIHLVLATQRPSVDVVTGLIKANCPARIAFAVAGSVDSRVILDQPGAERLLGKGDMLYLSGNSPAPLRMQGVHVSNEEINRIIRFWKLQAAGVDGGEPMPLRALLPGEDAKDAPANSQPSTINQGGAQPAFWDMTPSKGKPSDGAARNANPDEDELYQPAVDMVRRLEKASISLLQRRLRIGYGRAARLMDMMEERGVVGPPKEGSSKPRDVLPE